jgi:hypothetical protein
MGSRLLTYHNILRFESDKKPVIESCPRYNLLPYLNSKMWSLFSSNQSDIGSSSSFSYLHEINCNGYTKSHLHLLLSRFKQLEVNCKESDRFSSSWSLNRGHRMYLYQITQLPLTSSTAPPPPHSTTSNNPRYKNSPVVT